MNKHLPTTSKFNSKYFKTFYIYLVKFVKDNLNCYFLGAESSDESLVTCANCCQGIFSGKMIQCSLCYKYYHYCCHIPSITLSSLKRMLNNTANTQNTTAVNQPDFINSSLTNWTCSLCIDLGQIGSRILNSKQPSDTLGVNARKAMRYMVLKWYCQTEDSRYFRTCPDRQMVI